MNHHELFTGWPFNQYSPVTYVPDHLDGNAGHPDAEQGVLIGPIEQDQLNARVLYCRGRKIQTTPIRNLVWG